MSKLNGFKIAAIGVCTVLLTGCGIFPKSSSPINRENTVKGEISIYAQGVKLQESSGADHGAHVDMPVPIGPIVDATVVFFTDSMILGQTRTRGNGFTPEVSLQVPQDPRYDALQRAVGKNTEVPGTVNAIVIKDGLRPTIVTGIPIIPNQGQAYTANMWPNDAIQAHDIIIPAGLPMTESVPLRKEDIATKRMSDELVKLIQKEKIPALKALR